MTDDKVAIDNSKVSIFSYPEPSGWKCEMFGTGENGMVFFPSKGSVPNAFWRLMQYLILGNKWKKIKE